MTSTGAVALTLLPEIRQFIERAPFLFIGSAGADGRFDVSPRGDDPAVLLLQADGTLLMPDRAGNNRIDTLRNVLERQSIRLALLSHGEERYLQLDGRAEIVTDPALLEQFAVRAMAPASAMRIHVGSAQFVSSRAFADAGFWAPLDRAVAALPLRSIIDAQIAWHSGRSVEPAVDAPATLAALQSCGLKDAYPPLEGYVKGKAFADFDPHTSELLHTTRFVMLAFDSGMLLLGGPVGFAQVVDSRHVRIRSREDPLRVPPACPTPIGALFGGPGRNETLRVNGTLVSSTSTGDERVTLIRTEEIYLHCANAFARSRIWRPRVSLAWGGTRRFVCRERIDECVDVASFVLTPEDDDVLPPFRPGQYVTVQAPEDPTCPQQPRCYSLSDAPGHDHYRITVRAVGEGAMSRWLHERLQPGFRLVRLGAPRGRFVLDEASPRIPVLISAGVGLTPVVSMLAHLTATAPERAVWFIHGARNSAHHAMRRQLRTLAQANPGLRTHIVYSQPTPDDRLGVDYHEAGRIDLSTIERLLDIDTADFYLCGPREFMTSIRSALQQRGVPRERIRLELFGAEVAAGSAAVMPKMDPANAPTVTFRRAQQQVRWTGQGSLLDVALNAGLDVPYICRSGDCQSCGLRLLRGEVAYPEDLEVLAPEGYVLMCQAMPAGDVEIDL